jgi:hypothetical protein
MHFNLNGLRNTCFCYLYNNYQIKEPKFLGGSDFLIPL